MDQNRIGQGPTTFYLVQKRVAFWKVVGCTFVPDWFAVPKQHQALAAAA
jgi:hypothetical protein